MIAIVRRTFSRGPRRGLIASRTRMGRRTPLVRGSGGAVLSVALALPALAVFKPAHSGGHAIAGGTIRTQMKLSVCELPRDPTRRDASPWIA